MYDVNINKLQLSSDNSDAKNLLYEALSSHGIPRPGSIESNGYTRWGHKARYWLIAVPNGYRFGDHHEQSSYNVFFDKTIRSDRCGEIYESEEDKEEQYAKAALRATALWKRGKYAEDHPFLRV